MNTKQKKPLISRVQLLLACLPFFIIIVLGGYLYYQYEENSIRKAQYNELKAITDLKIGQIIQWQKERLGDAHVFAESPLLWQNIKHWFISKDSSLENDFLKQITLLRNHYNYENIFLISTEGKLLLSLDKTLEQVDPSTNYHCKEALRNKKPHLSDFYFCRAHHKIHYDVFAPILDNNNIPIAVIVLRINPHDYLYPLIQSWPTTSKTGETLIVKKDGDSVMYLNELRHSSNTALKLRIPLTNIQLPAVQAVLGHVGIWEGADYRGVEVLANICPVSGTDWYMVTKADKSEVFSELYYRATIVIIIIVVLLFLFVVVIAWIYNNRQKNIYIRLLETANELHQSQEEFRTILYSIGDAIITTDKKGLICNMNSVAEKLTGWNETSAKGKSNAEVFRIVNENSRETVESPVEMVLKNGIVVGLANHTILISKSGKEIPIDDSGAPIFDKAGKVSGVVLVFRDQTEERAAQKALKESETRYRTLFESMLNGFAYCQMLYDGDRPIDFIYLEVNKVFESLTGLKNVTGRKVTEIIPGIRESDENLFEIYSRVALSGKPETIEIFIAALNAWYSISVYSPKKEYFIVVFDVITERKLSERLLQESETKFKAIFENSHDAIGVSKRGVTIFVNPAYLKLFGFENENEITGKSVLEQISPKEHQRILEYIRKRNSGADLPKFYETIGIRKNGIEFPFEVAIDTYFIDNDKYTIAIVRDITERKKAEEALLESEEKFRKAFSTSPDSITITRKNDGMYVDANNGFTQIFGYSKEEIFGKTSLEIKIWSNNDDRKKFIEELDAKGFIENFETKLYTKSRKLNTCLVSSAIIELNGISHIISTTRDITGRKLAEEALRESENKFRKIYEDGPFGMAMVNSQFRFIAANPAFCILIGYSEMELQNKTIKDLTYPEDINADILNVKKLINKEIPIYKTEKRYVKKDGNVIWGSLTATANCDGNGNFLYNLAIIEDITARKHAEEALRLKNLVFDVSLAANSISNLNGIITEANHAFVEFWGYSNKNEVIGKSIAYFLKYSNEAELVMNALQDKGEWEGEYTARRKDNSTFIAHSTATVVKNETGAIIGYQSAVLDVTEKKKAEEEIKKLNESLEQRVIQRTMQLEEAVKELEAFSYSVSHDLRAPLRHISGFVDLLNEQYDDTLPEKGRYYLKNISESALQMGKLIDDLLQFSRTGRQEMKLTDIDINILLKEVLEEVKKDSKERIISWSIPALPNVYGDYSMVRLVLVNLLSNAVKYTSTRQEAEIEIGVSDSDKEFVFFIRDNGVGFDMKYAHKLFGVFQRLHSSEQFEGTGIGLANVRRIISKHGGRTWAEAELNKGATFYFTLPKVI
jgi:PAS domain S-box-containing protein